jgi:hypothetical protein
METVEIKWLKTLTSSRVGQVYSSGPEYCFISDDMQQCHVMVYCKDFLQDAVQSLYTVNRLAFMGLATTQKISHRCVLRRL